MTPESRDRILAYSVTGLWALWFAVLTPNTLLVAAVNGILVGLMGLSALLGTAAAIWGVVKQDHLIFERNGARLLLVAPIMYTIIQGIQVGLDLQSTGMTQRSHLIILGLALSVWVWKRYRQLSRLYRTAKETPLSSEE